MALALCPPSDVSQERGSSTRRRPLERRNGGQGEGAGGGRAPERGPRAWPPSAPRPLPTRSCHGPLSPNVSPSHLRGGVILGTLGTCHSPWDASQLGSHGRGRGPCVRLWWGPASAPRAVSEAPRCPAKGGERASPGAGSRDSRGLAHGPLGTGDLAHGAVRMRCPVASPRPHTAASAPEPTSGCYTPSAPQNTHTLGA